MIEYEYPECTTSVITSLSIFPKALLQLSIKGNRVSPYTDYRIRVGVLTPL